MNKYQKKIKVPAKKTKVNIDVVLLCKKYHKKSISFCLFNLNKA